MCEIGKALQVIDVEPLSLPVPLRREKQAPSKQLASVKVPVAETASESSVVEKS